jgi:CheY-like chemotaxis protein
VEDDPATLALTHTVLTRNGYRVLVATDGPQALTVWEANAGAIGLLLTDIVMPQGMSGPALAARLRAGHPTLKVLLTSGYGPHFTAAQLEAGEYAAFLHKPFTPDQLLRAVRKALGAPAVG